MSSIAVIIPAYNHASFLPAALASVLAQTRPSDEVIVVDDGSTDETPVILSRYANRVSVIRQPNQGVAEARNRGVLHTGSDLLAFLDADDVWLPKKLELQATRFEADPKLGLVHCGVEEIDAHGTPLQQRMDGLEGDVSSEMLLFRRSVILGGGSGVMIRRAAFSAVGGFDPNLSTSADWDLYFRLALQYQVGFVPEVLLRYRLHDSNMHRNVGAMARDMLYAYDKAFQPGSKITPYRRRGYGNLHRMLAGSYFHSGNRAKCLYHAWKSLTFTPENALYFLTSLARRCHRQQETPQVQSSMAEIGVSK